ncbi:MAG: ATP-binding protein [Haloarcula sp.]
MDPTGTHRTSYTHVFEPLGSPKIDDGAELLVGELFQSLAEAGHTETRAVLLDAYQDSAVRERDQVLIRVADSGPGLPETEQTVLTTGTETQLSHSRGTGLWLTQWIVSESDGSISVVESRFGGTTVEIRLRRPDD